MTWTQRLGALTLCTALAVLHTWPLARDLASQSRLDNADTALNTWIVAWVARELPRHPTNVFDAPIFYPELRTLAYSEHLLAQGVMAIPLRAAGFSVTTTYNTLVLIGLALGAWAMWMLVTHWTGDVAAGAVAGLAFAFNAHLLTRFAHLQALHPEFVPVVLLALDAVIERGRWRDGVLLGCGLALVGLTSIYLLTFMAGAVCVGLLARAVEWWAHPRATLTSAAIGVAMGMALLAPVLWPYWVVSHEVGLVRTLAEAARYGATWRDYLATGGRLHSALWSARFFGGSSALFPGLTVVVLAGIALADPRRHRGRTRMLVAMGLLGVALSLGPAVPVYEWLYDAVPLLRATRVASRWGFLFLTAGATLAGLGMAAVRTRVGPRVAVTLACLAPALVTVEALRAPMAFTPTPPVPAIYHRIAELPRAVLLEFPLFPGSQFNLNAPYLLAQTEHVHPIVAGYSGFATTAFTARVATFATFPSEASHALMREIGVTHVVLHVAPLLAGYGQAALDAVDRVPWLTLAFADGTARVYAVVN